MNYINKTCLLATVAIAALVSSSNVMAQTSSTTPSGGRALEEIVVTARRTAENLQTTPLAVSVVSQDKIAAAGTFSPERLGQLAPGLHVSVTTPNRDQITLNIRGQTPEYNSLFPSVVPYLAEVPLNSLTRGQFYDLENLQVLRGPQGVRFGRVTNGGALLLQPRRPGSDFAGNVEVRLGNHNLRAVTGGVTVPITPDVFSVRAAVNVIKRDGYTKNLVTGRDADNEDSASYRLSALFTPADWLENYTVYQYSRLKTNGTGAVFGALEENSQISTILGAFGPAFRDATLAQLRADFALQQANGVRTVKNGLRAYGPDGGMRSYRKSDTFINTTTIRPAENIEIKNILGYLTYVTWDGIDIDGSGVPMVDSPNHWAPTLDQTQLSDELQLHGKSGIFDYTLGLYADDQKPTGPQERSYIVQIARVQRASVLLAHTKSRAAYANGEVNLSSIAEGLKINGGIRYTKDTNSTRSVTYQYIADPNVSNKDPNRPVGVCLNYGTARCITTSFTEHATTYEAGVSYQRGRTLFYGSYKKGYRPGGVNTTVDPSALLYGPERNSEFEIGVKTDFNIGGMPTRLNVAAYHDSYKAIQKAVSYIFNGATTTNITNIADGTVQGVEYELTLEPLAGLTLGVSGAYTDAKYKRGHQDLFGPTGACNGQANAIFGFCTLSRFLDTPMNTVTVDFAYRLPLDENIGKITLGADFYHQSSVSLGPRSYYAAHQIEPGYSVLNLNASWEHVGGSPVDLRVFATNVTNKEYRIATSDLAYKSGLGTAADVYSEPRMFGVGLTYKFGADAR